MRSLRWIFRIGTVKISKIVTVQSFQFEFLFCHPWTFFLLISTENIFTVRCSIWPKIHSGFEHFKSFLIQLAISFVYSSISMCFTNKSSIFLITQIARRLQIFAKDDFSCVLDFRHHFDKIGWVFSLLQNFSFHNIFKVISVEHLTFN